MYRFYTEKRLNSGGKKKEKSIFLQKYTLLHHEEKPLASKKQTRQRHVISRRSRKSIEEPRSSRSRDYTSVYLIKHIFLIKCEATPLRVRRRVLLVCLLDRFHVKAW